MTCRTPQNCHAAKRAWRMAGLVKSAVDRNHTTSSKVLRVPSMETVKRVHRLISLGNSRQYNGAARILKQRMLVALNDLQREVDEAIYVASASMEARGGVSIADITADLLAIETEFPACDFDFNKQLIKVTTESVELEGTQFGAFQIELQLRYLGQHCPYRVIAVDPNPASNCDSTTHPHVQSETLCEGEGQGPIKLALEEGRLLDFFTIVNQVLHTYNAHSAYTTLGDWSGAECRDCGSTVDEDEISTCTRCDGKICGECVCSCERCDEVYCDDCTTKCEGCHETFCGSCIGSCDRCNEPYCEDCLTEDKCDDCTNEEDKATSEEPVESAEPAVHTICVGEAAVSA